jgi:hypothetical protein
MKKFKPTPQTECMVKIDHPTAHHMSMWTFHCHEKAEPHQANNAEWKKKFITIKGQLHDKIQLST